MVVEWGNKKLEEWKEKGNKMLFHEYYDLVVRTAEKHAIESIYNNRERKREEGDEGERGERKRREEKRK